MDTSSIGYMACYKCGNTIPVDSEFCPFCGIKLFVTCPKCGHRHSSQYPICNKCGTNRENYFAEQRRLEQMRMIEEQRRKDEEERRKREEQKRAEEERLRKESELKRAEEERRRLELERQEEEKQRKARVIWKELTGSVDGSGIQTYKLSLDSRTEISNGIKLEIYPHFWTRYGNYLFSGALLSDDRASFRLKYGFGLARFAEILLKNIVIPKGVKSVDGFKQCICDSISVKERLEIYAMVQSIEIPDSVEVIENGAFSCTSIESIEIPDSVKIIREGAFTECLCLKSFKSSQFCPCGNRYLLFENTLVAIAVKGINRSVFKFPQNVKRIGWRVFAGCTFLKIIDIPDSVESIGQSAFERCTSLEKIIIPSSVKSIGKCAFHYCEKLNRVTFRGVPQIDKSAFEECGLLREVIVPKGSRDYFKTVLPEEIRIVEM